MTDLLGQIITLNRLGDRLLAEPYAGGAGASLTLLYLEKASRIAINDADPAIHAFWWSLTHRYNSLIRMVEDTPVSIDEWRRQRDFYRKPGRKSRLELGFSAFYLNRCNRSGIVTDGGPIGGVDQSGAWKVDARFNKSTLTHRLLKVAEYRTRIAVSGLDGIEFIRSQDRDETFFFIDPPYFHKGETLYLNSLDVEYHTSLSKELQQRQGDTWVLTYDDCPEIRSLYEGWATIRPFSLRYVASERRHGREILITPRSLRLPTDQRSGSIIW